MKHGRTGNRMEIRLAIIDENCFVQVEGWKQTHIPKLHITAARPQPDTISEKTPLPPLALVSVSLTKRTSHAACGMTEKDTSQPYTGTVAKKRVINILEITKLMESRLKKMPSGMKILGGHY